MEITDRKHPAREFICTKCGWQGNENEFTAEDENGNDMCPACNCIDFEEVE